MRDYLAALDDASEETITFPTDDGVACFKINDIYYFMLKLRKRYMCILLMDECWLERI